MSDPSHILRIARTKGLPYCNHPRIPSRTLYALGYSARPDLMDPGHRGKPIVPLPDTTRKCGEIFLETVDRASGTSHLIGECPR